MIDEKKIKTAAFEEAAKIAETTVVNTLTHPCLAHYDNDSKHCATVRAQAIAAAIRSAAKKL